MKEKNYSAEDDLDIKKLIIILRKNIFLILTIIFLSTISAYLYSNQKINKNITKQYKLEFTIKNPPSTLFYNYAQSLSIKNDFNAQFNNMFKSNLLSPDNFLNFIEQSNDFDNLKVLLKSRNSIKFYHIENFGHVLNSKNIIIENKYFLNLPEKLDGESFVNKYLNFTKKKTIDEIKKELKYFLEAELALHQDLYEKSKILNLNDSVFHDRNYLYAPNILPKILMGAKYLSIEINSYKLLLSKLENDSIDYDILLSISPQINIALNSYFIIMQYSLAGFAFGLFLSLFIIGLKNIKI
jgi:hypothetical protein